MAYCHERRAPRHFRASRILDCIDAATGEVFTDVHGYLRSHVLYDVEAGTAAARATTACIKRRRAELAALVFLARCDGRCGAEEIAAIVDYIEASATPKAIDRVAAFRHLARMVPDLGSCLDGLQEIAQRARADLQRFANAVGRIIEADGHVDPAEVEFLADLQDALQENDVRIDVLAG
jgi:hypothetical protein